MKKHLIISVMGYFAFGIATGMSLSFKDCFELKIALLITCYLLFIYSVFFSLGKVKDVLKEHDEKSKTTQP